MKVYHGTTKSNGALILKDGKLKSEGVERHFNAMFPTTDGYVYLGTLDKALYYANVQAVQTREDYLYVFEIDIPDDLLLIDIDEIEYTMKPWPNIAKEKFKDIENPTFEECWEACKTTRVKEDILFNKFKTRLAILESSASITNENTRSMIDIIGLCNKSLNESSEEVNNYCNTLDWKLL